MKAQQVVDLNNDRRTVADIQKILEAVQTKLCMTGGVFIGTAPKPSIALYTVAYRQYAAETSTEHTATTRLYNPPDGIAVLIIALVIPGILVYVFYRKR